MVEDDPQVRASVVGQLQSLGYAVPKPTTARPGWRLRGGAAQPFDLMLTDVVMPGAMNGKALADEVGAPLAGDAGACSCRATPTTSCRPAAASTPGVRLLNKPFRKTDLAPMIRKALRRGMLRFCRGRATPVARLLMPAGRYDAPLEWRPRQKRPA